MGIRPRGLVHEAGVEPACPTPAARAGAATSSGTLASARLKGLEPLAS